MSFDVEDLRLRPGRAFAGHGLEVTITGTRVGAVARDGAYTDWFIDVHGSPFRGASARTRLGAQLMLPYSLRQLDGWSGAHAREKTVLSFILGARKLPHATAAGLLAELADARASSDRPFVLELGERGSWVTGETDRAVALVLTRPSLLLASFESKGHTSAALDPSTVERGAALVERARRSHDVSQARRARLLARWWLLPLVLCAFCWLLLLAPDKLSAALPPSNLIFRSRSAPLGGAERAVGLRGCDLRAALPPTPSSLAASYELGQIAERLRALNAGRAPSPRAADAAAALLARAAALVGRAQPLSAADFEALPRHLAELEARRGVVARTRGVFSVVNACWLAAIVGIVVSIGPATYELLRPLRHVLARVCLALLRRVLEPAAEWAHRSGALEVVVWALPCALLVDARRAFEPETARLVAVSAALLAAGPCLGYTTYRWGRGAVRTAGLSYETACQLGGAWLACTFGALSLAFDSVLLGYGCVGGLFSCLGLSAMASRLCYAVGFRSKEAVERVACAAALLLAGAVALREAAPLSAFAGGARGSALGPLSPAVSVFGSIALHLALLIAAADGYRHGEGSPSYVRRNLLALGALLLCSAAGHFGGGEPGMANCAAVFACLHGLEKWTELHFRRQWSGWLLVLLVSCCVYAASLYAHDHPEDIAAIFA